MISLKPGITPLQQLLDFALITGRYLRESPITADHYR